MGFISHLEICANTSDTGWILTPKDFDPEIEKAYAHDEWERLSLEAADDDEEMSQAIRAFWDQHIPIHFDVSDGYAYHAIRLIDRSGQIVHGCEPEFEETKVVANSFSEFLAQL